ncbi:MAG: hypothetical protein SOZ62_02615 [Eubacteriales bacterium]|nr:hypothetical protein [Eubacteriales bacterium]
MIKQKYSKLFNMRDEKRHQRGYYIISYGDGSIIYSCTDDCVRELVIEGCESGLGVANAQDSELPYHINIDSSSTGAVKFSKQITLEFTKGGQCYAQIPVEDMRKIHGTMYQCAYAAITVSDYEGTTIPPVYFCPRFGVMGEDGTIQDIQNIKSAVRMNAPTSSTGVAAFWSTNSIASDELYPCPVISIGNDLTATCEYDCKVLVRALSWTEDFTAGTSTYSRQYSGFQRLTYNLPWKLLSKDGICDTLTVSDKEKRAYVTKRLQENDGAVSVLSSPQTYELTYTPIKYFNAHSIVKTFSPAITDRPKIKIKFYSSLEQ